MIQREVLAPIYQRLNDKDKRKFYGEHQKDFTTQGEETISEIFLPLEGHTADEVSQRAKRLVAELRAGKNFEEAVLQNSPVSRGSPVATSSTAASAVPRASRKSKATRSAVGRASTRPSTMNWSSSVRVNR